MSAVTNLPPEVKKQVRRDTVLVVTLLVAGVVCVAALFFVLFQTINNDAVSRNAQQNNAATLCRAQIAADDAANLSRSQNVTLLLIKGLILRNYDPDAIVKQIDGQVAANTASADARASSVDTCESKVHG